MKEKNGSKEKQIQQLHEFTYWTLLRETNKQTSLKQNS